jgi:hypothetical protein
MVFFCMPGLFGRKEQLLAMWVCNLLSRTGWLQSGHLFSGRGSRLFPIGMGFMFHLIEHNACQTNIRRSKQGIPFLNFGER